MSIIMKNKNKNCTLLPRYIQAENYTRTHTLTYLQQPSPPLPIAPPTPPPPRPHPNKLTTQTSFPPKLYSSPCNVYPIPCMPKGTLSENE